MVLQKQRHRSAPSCYRHRHRLKFRSRHLNKSRRHHRSSHRHHRQRHELGYPHRSRQLDRYLSDQLRLRYCLTKRPKDQALQEFQRLHRAHQHSHQAGLRHRDQLLQHLPLHQYENLGNLHCRHRRQQSQSGYRPGILQTSHPHRHQRQYRRNQ